MLTEDHVRHLLAEAATTIKPGPEPVVESPRRGWRLPVAVAAAVVLLVGAIVAASLVQHGSTPHPAAPSPSPTPALTVDAAAESLLGDPTFHLGPDQIPPIAGYPTPIAARILTEHGWVLSDRPQLGCPAGTATAVYPTPGSVTSPGTILVLTTNVAATGRTASAPGISTQATGGCPLGSGTASGNADPFLLWAEGLAPTPRFAGGVGYRDPTAGVHAWLSPAQAQNPAHWPHLTDFVAAATTPDVVRRPAGLTIVPRAVVAAGGPECPVTASCGERVLTVRSGGATLMTLDYTLTSDGSIDGVTLRDRRGPQPQGGPPDVVGDSQAFATARLQNAGYVVTPVYRVDCAPAGLISRVAVDGRNAFIGVVTGTGQCDDSALAPQAAQTPVRTDHLDHYRITAAEAVIAFARGRGAGPAWADRVAYSLDGQHVRTLTAAQAQHRAAWEACPAHVSMPCPASPLTAIRSAAGAGGVLRISTPPTSAPCLPAPGRPTAASDAASGAVTITPGSGHTACSSVFYVTLGLDSNDRVASVDLSLPR